MAARSLALAVGERREIELPGRGGAGYAWVVDSVEPEPLVVVERLADAHGLGAGAEPMPPGGKPPDNASFPERFVVEGRSAGRGRLVLALRRSWEQDAEPLERHEVDVLVR